MKSLIFILLSSICFSTLFAQVTIKGTVKDAKGAPINEVNIAIKDTYDGAATNATGNFSFSTSEKGAQQLELTKVGFKTILVPINIDKDSIVVNLIMQKQKSEDDIIIISAGSFEAGDKRRGATLSSLDVLTTAGANADISTAFKTLPGTQQVGEAEGLFVRGGTASETKVFIDGTLVNNFFYSSVPDVAGRGRFFPTIFKGTVFSTGGYSALYGQALSSALILESVDMPERTEANAGISVLSLGGGFQKLAKNKKSSYGLNYGYTNLFLAFKLAPQKFDIPNIPQFHNLEGNFRFKIGKTGFLKYYGSYSANQVSQERANLDSAAVINSFNLKNFFTYHNFSYKQNLKNRWKFNAGISGAYNNDVIKSQLVNQQKQLITNASNYLTANNFSLNNKAYYFNAKIVFDKRLPSYNSIRFGAEHNYSKENVLFAGNNFVAPTETVTENITSIFGEYDWNIKDNIAAKIGGRAEHSALLNKINVAPRASIAYVLKDKSQLSLAYGIFYQNPERRYLPTPSNINFMQSQQYILQYLKTAKGRVFRTEVFYKNYTNLIKTANNSFGQTKAINNDGFGAAKGVELFYRDKTTIKGLDYWISYSFLDTKRNFLNYPIAVQPTFAARHNGSLVVKKFYNSILTGFNISYTYSEGRPYFNPNQPASKFLNDKTKDFHTVSFSCNYLPKLKIKDAFGVIVLSVNNVFGFDQVYGYNYSNVPVNGAYARSAVTPPSKRFYFIGFFLNFGVDNRDDIINKNL
jgi:vitamin B12 transporter